MPFPETPMTQYRCDICQKSKEGNSGLPPGWHRHLGVEGQTTVCPEHDYKIVVDDLAVFEQPKQIIPEA